MVLILRNHTGNPLFVPVPLIVMVSFSLATLPVLAGKLQAVVQGSYFMRLILVIGISDTGHTIRTILAVYTVFTLCRPSW